jgi:AraC-like DNA-binding protein
MLDALLEVVKRYTDEQSGSGPFATIIDGLTILRSDRETQPGRLIFKPALCIVVQGAKWAIFGNRRIDYRAGQALVVSVEIPALGAVAEASPAKPFLGIILEFDLAIMREVMDSLKPLPILAGNVTQGVSLTGFDGPLSDCVLRLMRLLDTPPAIPVLYPAIMREICYWLLTGSHAGEIIRMTAAKNHTRPVLSAIHYLRDRFAERVSIEELASIAQMSSSAFHRQFKLITSMTPLQYQKQLRLLEARRLMLAEEANVETAAFQVGYESPSQFSREYSRLFGMSPRRHVASFREVAA